MHPKILQMSVQIDHHKIYLHTASTLKIKNPERFDRRETTAESQCAITNSMIKKRDDFFLFTYSVSRR